MVFFSIPNHKKRTTILLSILVKLKSSRKIRFWKLCQLLRKFMKKNHQNHQINWNKQTHMEEDMITGIIMNKKTHNKTSKYTVKNILFRTKSQKNDLNKRRPKIKYKIWSTPQEMMIYMNFNKIYQSDCLQRFILVFIANSACL